MEKEKYLIMDAHQYFVILKCTRQSLEDFIQFGKAGVLRDNGALDLGKFSEWLTVRGIRHRAQFWKERNPILRLLLKHEIKSMNLAAINRRLFLPDEEVDTLLNEMENGNDELCWSDDEIM